MMRRFPIVLALLVAGCAQYALVGPGRVTADHSISVEPGVTWNRATQGSGAEYWTMDGGQLDAVIFLGGVPDGKPLALLAGAKTDKLAPFRSTMNANEVMELFEATYTTAAKITVFTTRNLRPATLGDAEGFRFDVDYTGENEVESQMEVVGAVRGGKLYLIAYRGARLHYFPAHLADFERIVASTRLPAG